jgi:hypothetical protein
MAKISYGELLCRRTLKLWFPNEEVIYNYRPIWLRNPKTGKNLELDIYYPKLNIAVEFNGQQHKFLLQREKDGYKFYKCQKIGIFLISVYHPLDLYKSKKRIKLLTGIKPPSAKNDKQLFLEMKSYISKNDGSSYWFNQEKERSEIVEILRNQKRQIKRKIKLTLKREIRKALRFLLDGHRYANN